MPVLSKMRSIQQDYKAGLVDVIVGTKRCTGNVGLAKKNNPACDGHAGLKFETNLLAVNQRWASKISRTNLNSAYAVATWAWFFLKSGPA